MVFGVGLFRVKGLVICVKCACILSFKTVLIRYET